MTDYVLPSRIKNYSIEQPFKLFMYVYTYTELKYFPRCYSRPTGKQFSDALLQLADGFKISPSTSINMYDANKDNSKEVRTVNGITTISSRYE